MKKPRTEAQREASRNNGRKSKGPVTDAGKARSCMNAVTHGLTANSVVLPGESRAAFDAYQVALIERYQPQDAAEEFAVEEITVNGWRLRRCWDTEKSAFLDGARMLELDPRLDYISRIEARVERRYTDAMRRFHWLRDRSGLELGPIPAGPSVFTKVLHAQQEERAAKAAAEAAQKAAEAEAAPAPAPEPEAPASLTGRRFPGSQIEPGHLTAAAGAAPQNGFPILPNVQATSLS